MSKLKLVVLLAIVTGIVTSCQNEEIINEISHTVPTPSKEQSNKLYEMGVNIDNVSIQKITFLDGSTQDYFVNETDLAIPVLSIDNHNNTTPVSKQYRTTGLVSKKHRTIKILGYTGFGNALTDNMQTALQWAVNNYNFLNTSLNFKLSYGIDYEKADIVVYNNNQQGLGGMAGFPIEGKPHKWIQINGGNSYYSTNLIEHVITHEMGHCIGLRHTDYKARVCDGQNEGDGEGIGAIHITGTPKEIDYNSIMISCPVPGTDPNNYSGEFNDNDIIAIKQLYEE